MRTHAIVASPIGELTLLGEDGALCGLYMATRRHPPAPGQLGVRDDAGFTQAARELDEYFAGERRRFTVPLAPHGTPFQQRVWAQLREIPYGTTCSYGELARRIGDPAAVRAVAAANGRNPISIIVPCHRVIGADGALVGYGGGLHRKEFLLRLERGDGQDTLF